MSDCVRQILADLERLRERLVALSDDIWLNIDHHDPHAMKAGVELMQTYHVVSAKFDSADAHLRELLRRIDEPHAGQGDRGVSLREQGTPAPEHDWGGWPPHGLGEDFTHTKPYGFALRGQVHTDVHTWRGVYARILQYLATLDADRFADFASQGEPRTPGTSRCSRATRARSTRHSKCPKASTQRRESPQHTSAGGLRSSSRELA